MVCRGSDEGTGGTCRDNVAGHGFDISKIWKTDGTHTKDMKIIENQMYAQIKPTYFTNNVFSLSNCSLKPPKNERIFF